MRTRRRTGVAAVLALAVVVLQLVSSGSASAHATIDDISPADGSVLATAPAQVVVTFSEAMTADFIDVSIAGVDGHGAAESIPAPAGHRDAADDHRLIIDLPTLPDGSYQLRFRGRDREDLHEVAGRTSFAVGDTIAAPIRPAPPGPPALPESAAHWIFAVGLALLIGVLVVGGRNVVDTARRHRLTTLARVGLLTVIVGRAGVTVARAIELGVGTRSGWSAVTGTDEFRRLPLAALAALAAVPLLVPDRLPSLDGVVRRGRPTSIRLGLGWVSVGWLALLVGWGDHAALRGAVEPEVALAKAAHLLGLGLWAGVLAVAVVVSANRRALLATLAPLTSIALFGLAITVASGLLLAGRLVVSLTALGTTTFGKELILKLGVLALAVGAGALARWRRRSASALVELALVAVVIAGGALLSTSGPATGREFLTAGRQRTIAIASTDAADLLLRFRAVPNLPGTNTLEIQIANTRRPAPGPITGIDVDISGRDGSSATTAVPDANGLALLQGVRLAVGASTATVTVHRPGLPPVTAAFAVDVIAPYYAEPTVISSRPMRNQLRVAAVLTMGIAVFLVGRSRKHRTVPIGDEADDSSRDRADVGSAATPA